MRYFAMIDGERRGPFRLSELADAGVRPDTYVWCKEMDDWEKAEDVADICRFFRQRIFDMMHPTVRQESRTGPERDADVSVQDNGTDPYAGVPLRLQNIARRSGIPPEAFNQPEPEPDTSHPPMPTLFLAIFMTLFCFPITGLVAVYYSYKARAAWQESMRSESKNNRNLYTDQERMNLRKEAHDFGRQAKMWIGITFFLSFILYALVGHKLM